MSVYVDSGLKVLEAMPSSEREKEWNALCLMGGPRAGDGATARNSAELLFAAVHNMVVHSSALEDCGSGASGASEAAVWSGADNSGPCRQSARVNETANHGRQRRWVPALARPMCALRSLEWGGILDVSK